MTAEPTGFGAVVEDLHGQLWVRCDDHLPWRSTTGYWAFWNQLTVRAVLNEGVTRVKKS